MTDEANQQNTNTQEQEDPTAPPRPSELEVLKQRAALMNITHSNNIGVDALRAKIEEKMNGKPEEIVTESTNALEAAALVAEAKQEERADILKEVEAPEPTRVMSVREYMLKTEMKLLRCRINNLDPKKNDLPGEIITVANEYLGTVRKFIPFGEFTDDGFHIPHCIYTFLKSRRFLDVKLKKDKRTGTNQVITRYIPEFSIEILEPLTANEIRELATAQLAVGSVDGIANDEYLS